MVGLGHDISGLINGVDKDGVIFFHQIGQTAGGDQGRQIGREVIGVMRGRIDKVAPKANGPGVKGGLGLIRKQRLVFINCYLILAITGLK